MTWHGMSLNLPLMTAYLMEYSVPDSGFLRPLILEWNMTTDDSFIAG